MRSLAAACLLLVVYDVASFELNIDPKFKVINERDNVTVICRSTVRLADCQFTWWDLDDDEIPESKFDFHLGPASDSAYKVNGSEVNWRLAGYRYVGSGLDAGECGIKLLGLKVRFRVLSCRVRELGKGWKYAYMTIKGNVSSELVEFSPTERAPVVINGNPFTINTLAQSAMKNCSFRFKDVDPIVFQSNRSTSHSRPTSNCRGPSGVRPACNTSVFGNNFWVTKKPPLLRNQCTITVRKVTEQINGLVYFEAWTESGHFDRKIFHLTVAEPPSNCTLIVPVKTVVENTLFEATCSVTNSRPLANITWYLGDTIIRHDSLDDSSPETQNDSPWRWDHELHSLVQTIVLNATRGVKDKEIKCVVQHLSLNETIVLVQRVNVVALGSRVMCPPITPQPLVDMECWFGNVQINCLDPMEVGSVVKMSLKKCAENFMSTGNMTCSASGEWKKPSLSCLSGCGKSRPGLQDITSYGQPVVPGQFPWHVTIYKLKSGKYEQVCAGSLLSLTTIITAASCFVKNAWSAQHFNNSLYKVIAGKVHRSWEAEEDGIQKRAVASLSVAPYYAGESSNYNYNLAFLKVSEPFQHTENVGPICFDRNLDPTHQSQFLTGKHGFLPGWGLTEEDHPGLILKAVRLPHVEYEQCKQIVQPAAQRLILLDMFCAGSTQLELGYTACQTDYGAGIVFLDNTTGNYVLRGVTNVAFKPMTNNEICYPVNVLNFVTFFTLDTWIKENLDQNTMKPHRTQTYGV